MKNENYWANRIKIAQDKTLDRIYDEYVANIEKQYDRAIRDIEKDILAWYQRFADNNELSYADAQKLLKSDELEEFKWTVQEYIEKGKENGITADWAKELENASARVHISRLESLKYQLRAHAEELTQGRIKNTTEASELAFTEGYYHTAFEFQKEIGVGFSLQSIDRVKLEKILNTPWTVDNQTFTARCWSDKAKLVEVINQELTRMVATGEAPKKTIERVAKQLETSKNNAGRVVMTESAYFATASQGECYKDLDVENYEVIETLDSHTCSFCGEMDGKVFPVNKMQAGSTAPPFHPWCRGTTAPYYEDIVGVGQRFARDIETGKAYYLPSDTTYEQWKAMQDAKYGEGSVDKARKMHYNEKVDREQFEKYKTILKDNSPKSFANFQNTKYNEPKDWKYLNGLIDYLQKHPESDKVYFDIQQELKKKELIKNAVVLPPVKKQAYILPEGKRDPYHIMHRMIERNITDDNLREYMSEAKIMISQWGGTRQRFVSEKGMCVIAKVKEDWIFKTAWKNNDYDESSNKMLEVIKNAGL